MYISKIDTLDDLKKGIEEIEKRFGEVGQSEIRIAGLCSQSLSFEDNVLSIEYRKPLTGHEQREGAAHDL